MGGRLRVLALVVVAAGSPAFACLWDSDTLRQEAAGLPGVLEVLVGRFDRFPPAYYERRIEIATARHEADGGDLGAYDDVAVSHDRLGDADAAIEWMAKKRAALDALDGGDSEHEYRYLANLGTFHAHRWIRGGADRSDLTDLKTARDLIAAAIELNPDAHFGREKYQLMAIEWLSAGEDRGLGIAPSPLDAIVDDLYGDYSVNRTTDRSRFLEGGEYADAVEGLLGLIVLGNAWASVDVHYALAIPLAARGDASLVHICRLRVDELVEDGSQSLAASWSDEAIGGEWFDDGAVWSSVWPVDGFADQDRGIEAWYESARKEAKSWRARRNDYVIEQIGLGRHPDTHPDYWVGWVETSSMPQPPNGLFGLAGNRLRVVWFIAMAGVIVLVTILGIVTLVVGIRWHVRRKRRASMSATLPS